MVLHSIHPHSPFGSSTPTEKGHILRASLSASLNGRGWHRSINRLCVAPEQRTFAGYVFVFTTIDTKHINVDLRTTNLYTLMFGDPDRKGTILRASLSAAELAQLFQVMNTCPDLMHPCVRGTLLPAAFRHFTPVCCVLVLRIDLSIE